MKPFESHSNVRQEWTSAEIDAAGEDHGRSAFSPKTSGQHNPDRVGGGRGGSGRAARTSGRQRRQAQQQQQGGNAVDEEDETETEPGGIVAGGATTTFEERTLWDLTAVSFAYES